VIALSGSLNKSDDILGLPVSDPPDLRQQPDFIRERRLHSASPRGIDSFIAAYNADARPFAWTKSHVHQKRLKPRFANQ
jgi:hypothetical protein